MCLIELQRRFTLQKNRIQRLLLLIITVLTFGTALFLSIQAAVTEQPDSLGEKVQQNSSTETGDPTAPRDTAAKTAVKQRLELSDEETKLMARAVYSEARGEQLQGQVAVAAVIINRVKDPDFPGDVAGVIFQPLAFTAVADGQFWLEPNEQAYDAVEEALRGVDPSEGALYYYNPATASSYWIFSRPAIKRIGNHLFCS